MRLHIDALGYLQMTWGAFGLMAGVSLGILSAGTYAASAGDVSGSGGSGDRTAVVILAVVGGLLALGGGLAASTGWGLRRRLGRARTAALVLAVPNLLFVPFGTGLGVYTLWVLLNDDARRAFGRSPRAVRAAGTGRKERGLT
ncbi:MAG: hypothetical protein HQ485_03850 [Acidobacteria bacterium]|jgi:hypothetical protein|nr:hypothetical protein [Acidobacteriota bacterium]